MPGYRVSARADQDLLDIYLYGSEQFGRPQAVKYQMSLEHCFELLAENPRMGRHSPAIRPNFADTSTAATWFSTRRARMAC
jgi:toxin ParE1/3/4